MDASGLLSVTEAAAAAGLKPDTLRRRCQRGTLRAARVGPIWVIERPALESWRPRQPGRPAKAAVVQENAKPGRLAPAPLPR